MRDAGTFHFEATYMRTRSDAAGSPETYMTAEGAVDLAADRGRMEVSLAALLEADEFEQPIGLVWDGEVLVARIDGRRRRLARSEARESAGLIGRFPDEPRGLFALLERPGEASPLGTAVVDGHETTGYRFARDLRAAGNAGVPVELSRAFAEGVGAKAFALEAWLDAAALPRRLGYVVELEEVRSEGRLVLPERTIRVTYELSRFGDEVEVDVAGE